MAKVLVLDGVSAVCEERLTEAGFDVEVKSKLSEDELIEQLPGVDVVVVRSSSKITQPALEAGSKGSLKLVVRVGAGVDTIDCAAAARLGVIVENTPGTNARGVVELTLAGMLAMARGLAAGHVGLKEGRWEKKSLKGSQLLDKQLGIVGLGNIGQGVARLAKGFGMTVKAFDPVVTAERAADCGAELTSLEELFASSDFISLHASLNDSTRGLLDAEAFARMQDGVFIANCARAGLVDAQALVDALDSGKVGAYYTDVFEKEPPTDDDPVVAHPKTVVTPHVGGSTEESEVVGAIQAVRQITAFLTEGRIVNAVNFNPGSPELQPYESLAERIGRLCWGLNHDGRGFEQVKFTYSGSLARYDAARVASSFFVGLLGKAQPEINLVSAPTFAREAGTKVVTVSDPDGRDLLTVDVTMPGYNAGYVVSMQGQTPVLHSIDGYALDMPLTDTHYLVTKHTDVPGIVGIIGTELGAAGINIEKMALHDVEGQPSMAVISTRDAVPDSVVKAIANRVAETGGDIKLKTVVL